MQDIQHNDKNYFIDTNIIMYAAGKNHKYKIPCVEVLERIDDYGSIFFINTETIQEILYRYNYINLKDFGLALASDTINLFEYILTITIDDLNLSIKLMKKYDSLISRDALIAANMINNNLKNIITADRVFDDVEEIKKIDPLDFKYL